MYSRVQLKLRALRAKINLFSQSPTFNGGYCDSFEYKVTRHSLASYTDALWTHVDCVMSPKSVFIGG